MLRKLLDGIPNPWEEPRSEYRSVERLLVFLGNPGPEYKGTRHNLGFMTGTSLLEQQPHPSLLNAFKGEFWAGRIRSTQVGLLMPTTFMNESGKAVAAAIDRLPVEVRDVVVVYDDMDLKLGTLKIRLGGSSGGHLGVKSIIDRVGSPEFLRIRMGVGRPPRSVNPVDFLLEQFLPSELTIVDIMIRRAMTTIMDLLHRPPHAVMTEVNQEPS